MKMPHMSNSDGPEVVSYSPSRLYAHVKRVELEVPTEPFSSERELKEWIWENHKEKLLSSMMIKHKDEQTDLERAQRRLALLDKIVWAQRQCLQNESPRVVFGSLLGSLLQLTNGEYGFIGETKYDQDCNIYLQTQAYTNIAGDSATQTLYEENADSDSGHKFTNHDSLFGKVLTTAEPVISNNLKQDPFACGIPEGQPLLNCFLGIPFFKNGGAEMHGMVGIIGNKPGGFTQEDIDFLEPFTATCSNLLEAYCHIQERKDFINTSKESVRVRTQELQLVNKNLEDANRRVLESSAAQMQHFACMSHEIRTPLNCIIGLSSLLQETRLNAMQAESLNMIVNSGDLLLTVVNDVLDYSKLESGNVEIEIRKSNLQETLNSFVHSIETKAQAKQLTFRTYYDTALPEFVTTDSRRLQQILYNLLGNAIKFSEEGSVVELHVTLCDAMSSSSVQEANENEREAAASCPAPANTPGTKFASGPQSSCESYPSETSSGCFASDFPLQSSIFPGLEASSASSYSSHAKKFETEQVIRFIVKDYGKGIAKKDFGRIFKPFQQASAETERVYGGTGLGLTITAKLANALGGTIDVDSNEGEWSKFIVDLPFRETPVDIVSISQRLLRATILLVHKDTESLVQVKDCFRQYNVHFFHFMNLDEMEARIVEQGFLVRERSYMCLVDEDLYSPEPVELLSNLTKSILLTFGSNFSVKESAGHYRSLVQVLPSVFFRSLGGYHESLTTAGRGLLRSLSTSSMSSVPSKDLRVLIAEDNVINQKVLHRMLTRLGLEVIDIVGDGQKAVDREASHEYDVILMDMQMPVMDGVEACSLICSRQGGHPNARVIFVTAHASSAYQEECAKAGGVDFLSKPFNLRDIEECLDRL
jgi:signal transduction histidine kinase/CheY-like chemotaxis protein